MSKLIFIPLDKFNYSRSGKKITTFAFSKIKESDGFLKFDVYSWNPLTDENKNHPYVSQIAIKKKGQNKKEESEDGIDMSNLALSVVTWNEKPFLVACGKKDGVIEKVLGAYVEAIKCGKDEIREDLQARVENPADPIYRIPGDKFSVYVICTPVSDEIENKLIGKRIRIEKSL